MQHYKNLSTETLDGEIWKVCDESSTMLYEASTLGRIKSIIKKNGKVLILSQGLGGNGYLNVCLTEGKSHAVHRIIGLTFISNPENKPTLNHKNISNLSAGENKLDNRVENLEWATYPEQTAHARETGLWSPEQLSTPTVILNTNGELLSTHTGFINALDNCEGVLKRYDDRIHIKGNKIVMHKELYEELTENEIFSICSNRLEMLLKPMYLVDGELVETHSETLKILDCSKPNLYQHLSNKQSAKIKGHDVIRLKNRIGIHQNDTREEKIYETITIG
ncbi:NUMOD4 domain-containing protein [Peribacillus simplex]|uniref:NUMOD4 domain-containing protein n=1 Tax=Peribacillus simplex TaxID=1478 RepID=UPI002E1B3A4E|nr:NUMOD4 domain-containing protein [Peribacillus simplex]MED3986305.1 NUMOD4 domain-containing protein [Peribacillus simplex]MED4096823.1 NUMOD4 domain-containing protein [Peribacillus simplex]